MNIQLNSILSPLAPDDFFQSYYEKKWISFTEGNAIDFQNLFTFEDLEEYLFIARPWDSSRKEFKCAKFPEKSFEPAANSVEDVLDLYSQGYTLILNSVHHRNEKIAKVCAQLSNTFFCPVQANIYVTPAGQQGFEAHFDTHDVFIVQTQGAKQWVLASMPDMPIIMLGDKYYNEYENFNSKQHIETGTKLILQAGHRLYIPRGTVHKATGVDDQPSLHITFSIFPITWNRLLENVVLDGAIRNVDLMKTVPSEVLSDLNSVSSKVLIKEKLLQAIENADISSLWRFIYDRDTVLLPGKGIKSILSINTLNEDSVLHLRECSEVFITGHKEDVWVTFADKKYGIPPHSLPFFEYMSDNYRFSIKNLPGGKDMLESKILVCKWLINNGLAILE